MRLFRIAAAVCLLSLLPLSAYTDESEGVVVTRVESGRVGDKAGVLEGDVLLSWERPSDRGAIESIFGWTQAVYEQAPRGPVKIIGTREGVPISFELRTEGWGISCRPQLDGPLLSLYEEGKALLGKGEVEEGLARWDRLAQAAVEAQSWEMVAWTYWAMGRRLEAEREWERAEDAVRHGLAAAESLGHPYPRAILWNTIGNLRVSQSRVEASKEPYREAIALLEAESVDCLTRVRFLQDLGDRHRTLGELEEADAIYRKALAATVSFAPGSLLEAKTHLRLASNNWKKGNNAARAEHLEKSFDILKRVAPESVEMAKYRNSMGVMAFEGGDLDGAEAHYREAIRLFEAHAHEHLRRASCLANLGIILFMHGDFDSAEPKIRQAIQIYEAQDPEGLGMAAVLNILGGLYYYRGDLFSAEEAFSKAQRIKVRIAPNDIETAKGYHNLGNISFSRGNLALAEEYFNRSLTIQEAVSAGTLTHAQALESISSVYRERGETDRALEVLLRAHEIHKTIAPESIHAAGCLEMLGAVRFDQGELDTARRNYEAARAIYEKEAPDTPPSIYTGISVGIILEKQGDLDGAEAEYRRTLDRVRRGYTGSPTHAECLQCLGRIQLLRQNLAEAEKYFREALAIQTRIAPGSIYEADTHNLLGTVLRDINRPEEALDHLRLAVDALESQRGKLGGSQETRAEYAAEYQPFYRDYMDLLLQRGKPDEALHVLERSRARELLAMLEERDLVFSLDIPEELEQKRRIANAEYDQTLSALVAASPEQNPEEVEELKKELEEIHRRQEQVRKDIRKASPGLASLQYTQPLDATGIRSALDPGTLFLAYSLGEEKTTLFVLGPDSEGLEVLTIPRGTASLGAEIRRFRAEIEQRENMEESASSLSDALLRPVVDRIRKARRILISPDGPLNILPFGALMDPLSEGETFRYLVESRPVHLAVSATVYEELTNRRRSGREDRLVVFADPAYFHDGPIEIAYGTLRNVRDDLKELMPLPATRIEAREIGAMWPDRSVLWLGEEATEERAKATPSDATMVHFACHGLLDERSPLDSALVLTLTGSRPDRENGLLQAWEIFESLRLNADLVVLSACETGLGVEYSGEGIIGLTRAFQYAGAGSVTASLWSVADLSTSDLMKRFYANIKAGRTKDEALRLAQESFLKSPLEIQAADGKFHEVDASHPFHWAAFQLYGDWK